MHNYLTRKGEYSLVDQIIGFQGIPGSTFSFPPVALQYLLTQTARFYKQSQFLLFIPHLESLGKIKPKKIQLIGKFIV